MRDTMKYYQITNRECKFAAVLHFSNTRICRNEAGKLILSSISLLFLAAGIASRLASSPFRYSLPLRFRLVYGIYRYQCVTNAEREWMQQTEHHWNSAIDTAYQGNNKSIDTRKILPEMEGGKSWQIIDKQNDKLCNCTDEIGGKRAQKEPKNERERNGKGEEIAETIGHAQKRCEICVEWEREGGETTQKGSC